MCMRGRDVSEADRVATAMRPCACVGGIVRIARTISPTADFAAVGRGFVKG